ncbi:MAG: hypothetical protein K6A43_11855 [Treponema sp.]|nr:hypothetical protein [Treponema sp.]
MNHKKQLFSSILIAFGILFFSCGLKINVDEEVTLVTRPDVKEHDLKGFTLSTKLYTDNTEFINIFRRTVTISQANKKTYGDVILIGTLFPQNINSANKTYSFDDVAVENEINYQYKMSYYDSKTKEFTYSAWSDSFSLPADSTKGQDSSEISLIYKFDDNAFFVYNDESKSILLMKASSSENSGNQNGNSEENENSGSEENSDNDENSSSENPINENDLPGENTTSSQNELILAVPAALYGIEPVPALLFKKEGTSEQIAVKLSGTDKTFENEIHLISYLPDTWWKTQLIFCGVVGYQEKRIDDKLQYIHWTEPNTTLKIKKPVTSETGTTYADEPTFSVDTSASGSSFDFTLPK